MMRRKKILSCALLAAAVFLIAVGCASSGQGRDLPGDQADAALLEFPNTHWNDTPEAVIQALDIRDEQILINEQLDNGATNPEWGLAAEGLTFFGSSVEWVEFRFVKYGEDRDFGLTWVRVIYPENTEMADVQAFLIRQYGQGSQDYPPSYLLTNGTIKNAREMEGNALPEAGEHRLYWIAGITATEYLPQETQDRVIAYFTQREEDPIGEDAVIQWLELEPLAKIRWRDDATLSASGYEVYFDGSQMTFLLGTFG